MASLGELGRFGVFVAVYGVSPFGSCLNMFASTGSALSTGLSMAFRPGSGFVAGRLATTSSVLPRGSVPNLVGEKFRLRANGLRVTGRAVTMALGFASGGAILSWLGYHAAFLLDAGAVLVPAATLASLALRSPTPGRAGRTAGEPGYLARQRLALGYLLVGTLRGAPDREPERAR